MCTSTLFIYFLMSSEDCRQVLCDKFIITIRSLFQPKVIFKFLSIEPMEDIFSFKIINRNRFPYLILHQQLLSRSKIFFMLNLKKPLSYDITFVYYERRLFFIQNKIIENFPYLNTLTLLRMGFFGAAHRWHPSLKSVTHILRW